MIKLEKGKYYRTADERKVGPLHSVESNFATWDDPDPYYRTVTTDHRASPRRRIVAEWTDEPKLWRDMSDEEKGALLLAHHEGKVIDRWSCKKKWVTRMCGGFADEIAYRVRPEPKREVVKCWWDGYNIERLDNGTCTHRITFDLINGEPDTSSIKMEKL